MKSPHRESFIRLYLLASAMILMNVGCGPGEVDSEPSYADLVVIYNAELGSLDRLEKKRSELIATYEKQHRPDADHAIEAISAALSSTTAENREAGGALDPQAVLDQAVENAEKTQQVVSQLLDVVATQAEGGEAAAQEVPYSEEFKLELAALDEEIEKQQARVERARQARDAAETK